MISRRLLRIKALQTIYNLKQDEGNNMVSIEKNLSLFIDNFYSAYIHTLYYVFKTSKFAEKDQEIQAGKLLEEKRGSVSTKLLENPVIQALSDSKSLENDIEKYKIHLRINDDDIHKMYQKMVSKDYYQNYLVEKESKFESHQKMVIYVLNKVVLRSALFKSAMDDLYITWRDDREQIFKHLNERLRRVRPKNLEHIWKELFEPIGKKSSDFVQHLFSTTVQNMQEFQDVLSPLLKNWDPERLTKVDMYILNLALCEFIYFPNIPVKVTINEYIEIAKVYSTNESKDFINGVLDRAMKKLKNDGRINKSGRGLVEF